MKIIVTERQFKLLTEQTYKEVPGSQKMIPIAKALYDAVEVFGTEEEPFYSNLAKIKTPQELQMVNDMVRQFSNGNNLYDLINDVTLGFPEFEDEEKQKIVNILNKNKISHIIDSNGNVTPSGTKYEEKKEDKTKEEKKDSEKKKETLQDKMKELSFRKDVVATTLIKEAGGEKNYKKAMQAVLNVLINRSKIKGTKIADQALKDKQFSMWNGKNSTLSQVQSVIDESKKHSNWNVAMGLVNIATPDPNKLKDITNGATHYYVYKGSSIVDPDWKSKLKSTLYPSIMNPDNSRKIINKETKKVTIKKNINYFLKIDNHLFGKTAF